VKHNLLKDKIAGKEAAIGAAVGFPSPDLWIYLALLDSSGTSSMPCTCPGDLALSMGLPGCSDDLRVQQAVAEGQCVQMSRAYRDNRVNAGARNLAQC